MKTKLNPSSSTHAGACNSDRLIPLCDGRHGLRTTLAVKAQASGLRDKVPAPDSNDTLDFIASDETLDRYGEIITPTGWKLDTYRRNPVFQNSHQYGDIIFTLGKALITEVCPGPSGGQVLFQRIQFATNINPMARIAYGLYKGGFLNAVSVGFIPLRWEDIPRDGLAAPEQSAGGRRYLEQELLEVSSVAVPANPNALVLGLKSGAIEPADLREASELLRDYLHTLTDYASRITFRSSPAAALTDTRALGVGGNDAHLLQLARNLREILKRD